MFLLTFAFLGPLSFGESVIYFFRLEVYYRPLYLLSLPSLFGTVSKVPFLNRHLPVVSQLYMTPKVRRIDSPTVKVIDSTTDPLLPGTK